MSMEYTRRWGLSSGGDQEQLFLGDQTNLNFLGEFIQATGGDFDVIVNDDG
ncbi:predicted protein [Botrytis cinerea T4]|uniref:Uncharacterized protein n=1 Tax=Botryotinia fuckeliana (strain T4) TaxID=999810 RepID=G2YPA2_BOTF4|nr:predicted protein [Botrytis cinerea T4]